MLIGAPAEASWAHAHLARAWSGDLSTLEVEQLSVGLEEVNARTADGYWTLLILAIQADASGDLELSCGFVARFEGVGRSKKDLRVNTLRAACLLESGDTAHATKLAKSSARAANTSEPVDFGGIVVRAQEVYATALIQQWKAQPDDEALRSQAEKAIAAWEESAREHNDGSDLIEAMAYRAEFAP